jgi:hypothetical protein
MVKGLVEVHEGVFEGLGVNWIWAVLVVREGRLEVEVEVEMEVELKDGGRQRSRRMIPSIALDLGRKSMLRQADAAYQDLGARRGPKHSAILDDMIWASSRPSCINCQISRDAPIPFDQCAPIEKGWGIVTNPHDQAVIGEQRTDFPARSKPGSPRLSGLASVFGKAPGCTADLFAYHPPIGRLQG